MRRTTALLGLTLLLAGCSGVGDYLHDTFSMEQMPNAPVGDSENLRRIRGDQPVIDPLTPEPGNIWPGPVKMQPSLMNAMQPGQTPESTYTPLPATGAPMPPPGAPGASSHAPPVALPGGKPGVAPEANFPALPPARLPSSVPFSPAPLRAPTAPPTSGSDIETKPIVIDNGNGTSTIIKPDGSISTIPNTATTPGAPASTAPGGMNQPGTAVGPVKP